MGEYKKITKDDIDFPRYCLFFIKTIQERLDEKELDDTVFSEIEVLTTYPYCSDAFDLITKTFEKKGFDVKTPTFKLELINKVKHYNYKWRMKKSINCDDLPF